MAYCIHKNEAWYKAEREGWEKQYNSFLQKEEWNYCFENEEWQRDYEQCPLSIMIFAHLLERKLEKSKIRISPNSIVYEQYGFLFDVMHNPNKKHQPAQQSNKYNYELKFTPIYHTIGNFTIVPRTIIAANYGPKLQIIHMALNEIWPWFLKYLQDNWNEFPTKINSLMDFNTYMECSCQQMYFQSIFDNLYELYKKKRSEKNLNNDEWKEILKGLSENEKIKKSDKLISFNTLFENNNIKEIDEQICFLIELRGRYIFSLLKDGI